MTQTTDFDLSFRPGYFPESLTPEQLLANIKGKARRGIAREVLEMEGFAGLTAFLGRETLEEPDRQAWGAVHPLLMGGEYLPDLREGEVEIVRISLRSTTGDQISIRAREEHGQIRYAVVDEYETEYRLVFPKSDGPLTFGELIAFIDGSGHPEEVLLGGLVISHWNYLETEGECPEGATDFTSIESAYYPELGAYYEAAARDWETLHRVVEENEEEPW